MGLLDKIKQIGMTPDQKRYWELNKKTLDILVNYDFSAFDNFLLLPEIEIPKEEKLLFDNEERKGFYEHYIHHFNTLGIDFLNPVEGIEKLKGRLHLIYDLLYKTAIRPELVEKLKLDEKFKYTYDVLNKIKPYLNDIGTYYSNDYRGIKNGLEGEDKVNKEMKLYNDIIMNLPNIRLEVDGISVETNNLIICEKGIYAVEVKNIGTSGNFTINIDKDGRWSKTYVNGKEEVMSNITEQTYRHIGLYQKFINKMLKNDKYINIQPLIVLANDEVKINNNSDIPIVRVSNMYREIIKGTDNINKDTQIAIKDILLAYTLQAKPYGIIDYTQCILGVYDTLLKHFDFYDKLFELFIYIYMKTDNVFISDDYGSMVLKSLSTVVDKDDYIGDFITNLK